jgi:NAD(P)-dependent dehydrogenase (short-subunit alcohol dehydrogenase family)
MAVEAATQIRIAEEIDTSIIRLIDVRFFEELSLSNLREENGAIETSLTLQLHENERNFRFFISANTERQGNDWKRFCSGKLILVADGPAKVVERGFGIDHDATLLEYIESFAMFPELNFDKLQIDRNGASGCFDAARDHNEEYCLDPSILASLLQLPQMLLLGSELPALYHHEAIDSLEVPVTTGIIKGGNFNISVARLSPTRGKSDLVVRASGSSDGYIHVQGLRSRLVRLIERKVPLQSLFYKPHVLPDVTYLHTMTTLPLAAIIELVTHKWPMSDIGIMDISSQDQETVLGQLQGVKDSERPRFRSLHLVSDETPSNRGRTRTVPKFGADQKFHFVFLGAQKLPSSPVHLRSDGLVCVSIQTIEERKLFDDSFEFVSEVTGFRSPHWLLGRARHIQNEVFGSRKQRILACEGSQTASPSRFDAFEVVQLEKGSSHALMVQCKDEEKSEPLDLIVLDCGKESMLATWSGSELLPWIQSVVDKVGNLLWVSCQTDKNPFSGIAGSFIRTIQSEHPSIKAASLVFKDNNDTDFFTDSIFDVYENMVHGSCEVEVIAQDSQVCALRYQPDDELSASVGVAPPLCSKSSIASCNYEVSLAAPSKAVLICDRLGGTAGSDESFHVAIKASVVDCDDVLYFADALPWQRSSESPGQFFAGKIISGAGPGCESGTDVVGWQVGAHSSSLHVSRSHVFPVPEGMVLTEAAMCFAAHSVAFAILEGTARTRRQERIKILVHGVLAEALTKVCHYLGVLPIFDVGSDSEFTITFDREHGLLVNGNHVSVKNYMRSGLYQKYVNRYFSEEFALHSPACTFQLRELQGAFENAGTDPVSTVIEKTGLPNVQQHYMVYKPTEKLFRGDAAYVIVGGLGGLGRYLCAWMVANGARYLVTLSRSGLASEDARMLVEELLGLGAEVQVFQCDATDRNAVDEALAEVRKQRPICGCLNMVLVLDNSPLLTMKPAQWDRALRTKVDSTWNLHEATLCDKVDMFIMFSSVSSISGNRTQANYAAGNAFQNALAEYRRSKGLPGIAIALGAMGGIGVLADDHELLRTLTQGGLQILGPKDFEKIMEAAICESQHSDRSLLSVGFKMFETLDGVVQSSPEENQLFWTESAEFGFLLDHRLSDSGTVKSVSLLEQLGSQADEIAYHTLLQGFLHCLNSVLGYAVANLDPASSLASYGLDSLNAVSCRYWFFKRVLISPK